MPAKPWQHGVVSEFNPAGISAIKKARQESSQKTFFLHDSDQIAKQDSL